MVRELFSLLPPALNEGGAATPEIKKVPWVLCTQIENSDRFSYWKLEVPGLNTDISGVLIRV